MSVGVVAITKKIVVHVRGAEEAVAERVLDARGTGPARLPGVEATEGKAVLEMAVVQVSKGAAIDALRAEGAVLFTDHEVTDETALVRLRPGDVGIKVGDGDTAAEYRVESPEDVTAVLEELLAARFFFQAEDGIRDGTVTGVQTCALPICVKRVESDVHAEICLELVVHVLRGQVGEIDRLVEGELQAGQLRRAHAPGRECRPGQIGRASCRERV